MVAEFSWPLFGVIIPCCIIAFAGYGTYFFILLPRHESVWQLVWFQFSLTMTWLCYYLAITVSPGAPSPTFVPREDEWKRWCTKCNAYKPERAHHCRQCKRCVLKMDHHCPWTYNCVGHGNLPHFVRFLFWVITSSSYAFVQSCKRAYFLYSHRSMPSYLVSKSEIIWTVILFPVTFLVLFSIALLTIRVVMNMINGQTQIESWEIERVEALVRKRLVPDVDFPYDIDIWTNIVDSMGSPWTWWWPWARARGDGMHFEKNEAADGGSVWPPDHRDQTAPVAGSRSSVPSGPVTMSNSRLRTRPSSTLPHQHDFYDRDTWQNGEGERITDFGVDSDTDVDLRVATPGTDEVPLAVLMRQ